MHQDQEPMMSHRVIFELLTIFAAYCFVVEEFINLLIIKSDNVDDQ